MALTQSDILAHNNPNLAVADSDFIKGGFRTAVANLNDLYALSGKTDEPSAAGQLKARATFVYVTSEQKYYELIDTNNVGNSNGWQPFELGGTGTISGATNGLGLTNNDTTICLGGLITTGTTIYSTSSTCCAYLNFNPTTSTITTCSKGGCIVLDAVSMSGAGGKIIVNTNAGSGMTYGGCYHNNYTARSIPDVEYVNSVVDIIDVRYTVPANPFNILSTDNYIGVTGYTAGSCACIYLLPSPTLRTGQKVIVADVQGQALTYPITIDGNGKYINGNSATCAIINTDYGSITFLYNGFFWSAIAFVN